MTNAEQETKPDYEVAREKLNAMIDELKAEIKITRLSTVPEGREENNFHYQFELTRNKTTISRGVWSCGIAVNPSAKKLMELFKKTNPRAKETIVNLFVGERTDILNLQPMLKWLPSKYDIIASLLVDASCVDSCLNFEDFCANFGYDSDSRKAEATYRVCFETRQAMNYLFGNNYQEALELCNQL